MKIKIRKEVQEIIEVLETNGSTAYLVGGAVRNQLLGIPVKDWDLTTSATPDQMIQLFNSSGFLTVPSGIEHGTVTVLNKGLSIEITTYRIEGKYSDGRRPDNVNFNASLEEDLMRRDFTINAMAYNKRTGLIDLFGGLNDLKSKTIRCV